MDIRLRTAIMAAGFGIALGTLGPAQAQQPPYPGYGYGPGMMGGYGPGYGMGPGMMGGYGPGYGTGPGMGPGMMGGWSGPQSALKLSEAQIAQLEKIHEALQDKHRKLMSQMWDEQAKLANLYNAEKRDPTAIGKVYERIAKLQREALEAHIEAENKSAEVLTKEQRSQVRRGFGWGMMGY